MELENEGVMKIGIIGKKKENTKISKVYEPIEMF